MSISTSDLYDAHAAKVSVCDVQFRSFGRADSFAGQCSTVKIYEGFRTLKEALEQPGEERILVVDAGGSLRFGVLGDRMAKLALRNGWIGAIIFGAVRDSQALASLDFGVKALGTTARRALPDVSGLRDIPITIGGATFRPNDWVYADADAVLVGGRRLHTPDI
jgi:regulator of ribonuclease activity A